MKVQNSNIPEKNGKPLFESKDGNWKEVKPDRLKAFLDGEIDEDDAESKYKKTMIDIGDGIMIDVFDIHSIEKDMKFVEKPSAHWVFGLVINKGVTPSSFVKKVDVSVWYKTPELLEEKYDNLKKVLEEYGFSILKV